MLDPQARCSRGLLSAVCRACSAIALILNLCKYTPGAVAVLEPKWLRRI